MTKTMGWQWWVGWISGGIVARFTKGEPMDWLYGGIGGWVLVAAIVGAVRLLKRRRHEIGRVIP